jgi:protein-tyrosine phosphatase
MAEGLLKKYLEEKGKKDIRVISAGVRAFYGMPPTENTIKVMGKEGVDVSGYKTATLTDEMIKAADLVFVMEEFHKEEILKMDPAAKDKTFLLKAFKRPLEDKLSGGVDVLDPIGRPIGDYEYTLKTIKEEIERIINFL